MRHGNITAKLKRLSPIFLLVFLTIPPLYAGPKKEEAAKVPPIPYEELDLFAKVYHYIQNYYVEEVDGKKVVEGAIDGMLRSLDPHSSFLRRDVYNELKVDTEGQFGGIGIEITMKDEVLTVVTPLEGTPAYKAKIEAGDKIIKIDGTPTKEMSLADAVQKMRGKKGSKITLTLVRERKKQPFDVVLTREVIHIQSVRSELLEKQYGYVRINSFQEGTSRELTKALQRLAKGTALKGLILDLRNNPGGLLEEAIVVVDSFLKEGVIVSTKSRNQETDRKLAHDDGNEPNYPIVTLINGGSASASEIVAGALQDHHKAVLLGTTTFGKGSVQTVYELDKGTALKLTIARYYTASGRSIQAEGIKPDIVATQEAPSESSPSSVREKDLKGHLEEEERKSEKEKESEIDHQKQLALNYLKGLEAFAPPQQK